MKKKHILIYLKCGDRCEKTKGTIVYEDDEYYTVVIPKVTDGSTIRKPTAQNGLDLAKIRITNKWVLIWDLESSYTWIPQTQWKQLVKKQK